MELSGRLVPSRGFEGEFGPCLSPDSGQSLLPLACRASLQSSMFTGCLVSEYPCLCKNFRLFTTSLTLALGLTLIQRDHSLTWLQGPYFSMKSCSQVLGRGHLREHIQPSGLPRWLSGKASACQCRRHRRHGFDTYSSYSCLGNPMVGCSPWSHEELDTTEWVSTHTQPSTMFTSPVFFSLLWTTTTKDCFSHLSHLLNFVLWKFPNFHGRR